jgi:hypothetical protein
MKANRSDAQLVEDLRVEFQAMVSEAVQSFDEGKTPDEFIADNPLPKALVTVAAADLREIGSFTLDLPDGAPRHAKRQWVYRRRDDQDVVYVISWTNRMSLQQLGFAQIQALINDPNARN